MLLDDDVVTNGQPEPGAFTGRFCREERVEQLLPRFERDAGAVVAYLDFDAVAGDSWLWQLGVASALRFVAA